MFLPHPDSPGDLVVGRQLKGQGLGDKGQGLGSASGGQGQGLEYRVQGTRPWSGEQGQSLGDKIGVLRTRSESAG